MKVFVTSLVPLKLHDILCLRYDMMDNNAHDVIPVVCRYAHTDLLDIYYKEASLLLLETYQHSVPTKTYC